MVPLMAIASFGCDSDIEGLGGGPIILAGGLPRAPQLGIDQTRTPLPPMGGPPPVEPPSNGHCLAGVVGFGEGPTVLSACSAASDDANERCAPFTSTTRRADRLPPAFPPASRRISAQRRCWEI